MKITKDPRRFHTVYYAETVGDLKRALEGLTDECPLSNELRIQYRYPLKPDIGAGLTVGLDRWTEWGEHLPGCNMDKYKLDLATSLMRYTLRHKLDKQGRPLHLHCTRVAERLYMLYTFVNPSEDEVIAALLHDVIEESEDYSDYGDVIIELFGNDVYDLVDTLTRQPDETYMQYISRVKRNKKAIPIKLADLDDNLDESRGAIPDSLKDRYIKARNFLAI